MIDEKLGGTTPLEVIKFPKDLDKTSDEDEFDDWENDNNEKNNDKYWFTKR